MIKLRKIWNKIYNKIVRKKYVLPYRCPLFTFYFTSEHNLLISCHFLININNNICFLNNVNVKSSRRNKNKKQLMSLTTHSATSGHNHNTNKWHTNTSLVMRVELQGLTNNKLNKKKLNRTKTKVLIFPLKFLCNYLFIFLIIIITRKLSKCCVQPKTYMYLER